MIYLVIAHVFLCVAGTIIEMHETIQGLLRDKEELLVLLIKKEVV